MKQKPFYVYYLIDPRNNQPFYVGRGQKSRMYAHVREVLSESFKVNTMKVNRIREILGDGFDVIHHIEERFETRKEAQRFEIEEIKKYGRVDQGTGILLNMKTGDEKPVRNPRRVCQYNRFCELVETHESTTAAAEKFGIKYPSSLSNAVRGMIPSYRGFLWCYEGEDPRPLQKVRPVYQWTKDGELVNRFENAFRAAEAVNSAPAQINQHISKGRGSVKGFVFQGNKSSLDILQNVLVGANPHLSLPQSPDYPKRFKSHFCIVE